MARLIGPIVFVCLALAGRAAAQDAGMVPAQSVPRVPAFIGSYDFHLNAIHLSSDDERFTWDGDFGGDIDLVDYGAGRLNFLANYEAVIGGERGPFDVNQASYTLDVRATLRNGRHEVGAVFNHVSRHISDRNRPFAVDWNMIGAEYWRHDGNDTVEVRTNARALFNIQRSFVDYEGLFGGSVEIEGTLNPYVSAIGRGVLTLVPVDEAIMARDRQWGSRIEGGVRLSGAAGVVDLILGYERRIDAYPLEAQPHDWVFIGFRLLNR